MCLIDDAPLLDRCPICHEIYGEDIDCECPPIEVDDGDESSNDGPPPRRGGGT